MQYFFSRVFIVWFALLMGACLGMGAMFLIPISAPSDLKGIFEYIALAAMLSTAAGGQLLYSHLLQTARQKTVMQERAQAFFSATLLRTALFEGGSLVCSVAYLLTQTTWVLAGSLAGIALMLLHAPTKVRCQYDLQLSPAETEELGKVG